MQTNDPSSSRAFSPNGRGLMAAPYVFSSGDGLQQGGVLSATQLPTPQTHSPSNLIPYFPGVAGSPESPLAYAHTRGLGGLQTTSLAPRLQPRSASPIHEVRRPSTRPPQVATPETSPASSSKRRSSPIILNRRPSSAPMLSTNGSYSVKAESPPAPLGPAHIISPPVSVYSKSRSPEPSTTGSNLSSPFVEKLRLPNGYGSLAFDQRQQQTTNLLSPQPKPSLANATSLFSPVRIPEKRLTSIQPVPSSPLTTASSGLATEGNVRRPGGEIDRIRAHEIMLQQARIAELENRRPEYFKRLKRSIDEPHADADAEVEAGSSSLGILTSPVKGRRIQLFDAFQKTSEESFEESLMTNGYGMYGEPRTPQRQDNLHDELNQGTLNWLEHNTPAGLSKRSPFSDDTKPDDKDLKKRRRLEAFAGSTSRSTTRLIPTVIEGVGRILVPPEGVEELLPSTPVKKKAPGRRKKGGLLASPVDSDKRGKGIVRHQEEPDGPKWLDNEFPWASRGKEREEELNALTTEKMSRIERYLRRDSDSEESEGEINDVELLPPTTWGQEYDNPPVATRKGRGKAVPLRPNPARARTPPLAIRKSKNVFLPSDPADARAALLSKRSVRMFAQRRLRRSSSWMGIRSSSDEGQFACACGMNGHGDDGKPAVECSQCKFWYHFECIGIKDELELGDEDDTWFCSEPCREAFLAANALDPDPFSSQRQLRQPTFAPTDERPPPSLARGDIAFYSSSPLRPWGSSSALETPIRGPYRGREGDVVRRSLWDDANLRTPTGPSSPLPGSRNIKVTTPSGGHYDNFGIGHEDMGFVNFDPMSTPSRGSKFAPGLFATPKQPSFNANPGQNSSSNENVATSGGLAGPSWASRAGGMFATPTPRSRHLMPSSMGLSSFGLGIGVGTGDDAMHYARGNVGLAMYAADDTPIRRAPLEREAPRAALMSQQSPESPTPSTRAVDKAFVGDMRD